MRLGAGISSAALVVAVGAATPALAQAGSQDAQLQELRAQIQLLQRRIDQLEAAYKARQQSTDQAARDAAARARAAQDQAARAQARADAAQAKVQELEAANQQRPAGAPGLVYPPLPPGASPEPVGGPPKPKSDKPNGSFDLGGVTFTLGGFIELAGYFRSNNQNRSIASSFNTIPFLGPTPQGDIGEFGLTAQQSRFSGKAEGMIDDGLRVVGYGELDLLNGAGSANSVETNSYTPRLRQIFTQLEYEPWQAYGLAGQAWSLATPFRKGLDPFATWQPPVIDAQYIVGYDFLRVPALRVVKGFGDVWVGFEAATPQTAFGGVSNPPPPGTTIFTTYPGGGGLNPQANYSVNVAPDLLLKVAADTKPLEDVTAHFEAFGLARWFTDQISFGGQSANLTTFGGGIGGSTYVTLGKWFDIEASVLYGNGIGRYGAAQLPDVTFNANGSLQTLNEGMGTVGGVLHAIPGKLDLYGFYGWDWIGNSYYAGGGGYGNPANSNMGCFNPNAQAQGLGATCTGNTQWVNEITAGLNWNVFRGRFGTWRTGFQYSHIARQAYAGVGGSPWAADDMFMFNFRYLPFE
ncbi:MAG: hypothetical protein JOY64_17055 [Alphaproteobacteria bacterium]|nr:hypothetical protein [Alphaproteobacteria bacterium]